MVLRNHKVKFSRGEINAECKAMLDKWIFPADVEKELPMRAFRAMTTRYTTLWFESVYELREALKPMVNAIAGALKAQHI